MRVVFISYLRVYYSSVVYSQHKMGWLFSSKPDWPYLGLTKWGFGQPSLFFQSIRTVISALTENWKKIVNTHWVLLHKLQMYLFKLTKCTKNWQKNLLVNAQFSFCQHAIRSIVFSPFLHSYASSHIQILSIFICLSFWISESPLNRCFDISRETLQS